MTKIKFCGLSRRCDIEAVNELKPEYIGFVFVKTSKRYVSFEKAEELKSLLDPKIKEEDVRQAERSPADFILLDSGAGTGRTFEWEWIKHMERPYFLAGGIHIDNVEKALEQLKPYAIDVSSGIETEGRKDKRKMAAIMTAVRKERKL